MAKTKRKTGRPTRYRKEYAEQAKNYCLLGCTDAEMAVFFKVAESTLHLWKKRHKEFSESIKAGKSEADARVAASLYERAIGYSHREDKIFNANGSPLIVQTIKHYPPEPVAAFFWLKNRQPEKWRDKQEIKHELDGLQGIEVEIVEPKDKRHERTQEESPGGDEGDS